jgi:hypothetical protein
MMILLVNLDGKNQRVELEDSSVTESIRPFKAAILAKLVPPRLTDNFSWEYFDSDFDEWALLASDERLSGLPKKVKLRLFEKQEVVEVSTPPAHGTPPPRLISPFNTTPSSPTPSCQSNASSLDEAMPMAAMAQMMMQQQFDGEREHDVDLAVLHAEPLIVKDDKGQTFDIGQNLNLNAEREALVECLGGGVGAKAVRLLFEVATMDTLTLLLTKGCKALHFSGHGLAIGASDQRLCFEDGYGGTRVVGPELLHTIAANAGSKVKGLQLVFVSACHSEAAGRAFVAAGVPHVVAVQSAHAVLDGAAKAFARHFYLALFNGRSVQEAFTIGKSGVFSSSAVNPAAESSKFLLLGNGSHQETIFEGMANGQPVDLTPPLPPCSLPQVPEHFVGRSRDVHRVISSVRRKRVTVCVGAPGIGKSTLAKAAAWFMHTRRFFAGGIFFVDLDGLALDAIKYTITSRLNEGADNEIITVDSDDELVAELSHRKALLIFDKAEELLETQPERWVALLSKLVTKTKLRLLLTSRRPVHVPNVTPMQLNVQELSKPEAVELLLLMAPHCPRATAASLAGMVGYFPLALRVMGRTLSDPRANDTPDSLITKLHHEAERLAQIKGLNQVGERECVDACFRSSYDALDAVTAHNFLALARFRNYFSVGTAAAVLRGGQERQRRRSRSGSGSSNSRGARDGGSGATADDGGEPSAEEDDKDEDDEDEDEDEDEDDAADEGGDYSEGDAREFALQVLGELNKSSLLEHDQHTGRYRLHDLIRLFVEEEAKADRRSWNR